MHHCVMFSPISLDGWEWGGLRETVCVSMAIVFPVMLSFQLQLPFLYSSSLFAGTSGSVCLSFLPGSATLFQFLLGLTTSSGRV